MGAGRPNGATSTRKQVYEELDSYLLTKGATQAVRVLDELAASSVKSDKTEFLRGFTMLLEYARPKLSRAELTGKNGEALIPIDRALAILEKFKKA